VAPSTRRALTVVRRALAWLALIIGLFMLGGWVGSTVPRNSSWTEPADGIPIMIETNGIHTAIVVPLVTPQKDWRVDFPVADIAGPDRGYTHVSISWGERSVFLETPTWADLSPSAAVRAAIGSEGLLHVAHYVRPAPSETARVVLLRPTEYASLVAAIEHQVKPATHRTTHPGYEDWDVFYSAPGTYHLGNTCNQWTSDQLAAAGVKVGWWTPFAGGVMKWFDQTAAVAR